MSQELEIEKTYLAKYLPDNLYNCKYVDIEDIYIPKSARHAYLRIRKTSVPSYTITKKEKIDKRSASSHIEHSIEITEEEYNSFKALEGSVVKKRRYFYPYKEHVAEFDIYFSELEGLVLVDFEFMNKGEYMLFEMPDFCLADVTEEEFFAGGVICRSSYASLEKVLIKYNYQRTRL